MGSKVSVTAWGKHFGEKTYSELQTWGGDSLLRGLWEFWKAKRRGYGCVKLEWR